MLEYLPPHDITPEQVLLLMGSFKAGPAAEHRTAAEVVDMILGGSFVYRFGRGLVLVRKAGGRLVVDAIAGRPYLPGLAQELRRLAAEWACDEIETWVYDPRLAHAIQLCGARQEAILLVLEV